MINKIIILLLLLLFSGFTFAQNSQYKTHNYTAWKVVKADKKDRYVVVVPETGSNIDALKPICFNEDTMIFPYQMMGLDDSFYNKSAQAIDIKLITKTPNTRKVYSLKIDVEADDRKSASLYAKICSANKAFPYVDKNKYANNSSFHGMVKYIGDKSIVPPF